MGGRYLSTFLAEPDFSKQLFFLFSKFCDELSSWAVMSLGPFPGKFSQIHLVNIGIAVCGKSRTGQEESSVGADTSNHLVN